MTPEAKSTLSKTIRSLRTRLIDDLAQATRRRYRLQVHPDESGLNERRLAERKRLEDWLEEQVRAEQDSKDKRTKERFLHDVVKEAAYTLLNRVVLLRLMEETDLVGPAVIDGGWESNAYREFTEWAPPLLDDETQGYQTLLDLVFDELAHDLPGLYGKVGLSELVPVPPATLRELIEKLDQPELDTCWSDDTTFGWVYQYWNDPEREELDAKLNAGGKIEPHEVASKTQLFTERYMVEWLLQNSLGQLWLATCKKNGWTPEAEAHGVLDALEERRREWRAKREAGAIEFEELMPIHSELEERWKYWVPQQLSGEAVETAPESVWDIKILDPACGSGHFLVIAFDLLWALYQEEARHRGESWSDEEILDNIFAANLHGIDIDPRAVQIAAAALYLKARTTGADYHPKTMNLVAPDLALARLSDDDPALVEFCRTVEHETKIPADLTHAILSTLEDAYHLGSLLQIDEAIDEALESFELQAQGELFNSLPTSEDEARSALIGRLEQFLAEHSTSADLGLRLHGEQLEQGVRFLRMNCTDTYELVVANPPYLGSRSAEDLSYLKSAYSEASADLYAAFLLRGSQLARRGGISAMVTMHGWTSIKLYRGLRETLLSQNRLQLLADLGTGAFGEIGGEVVSVLLSVITAGLPAIENAKAIETEDSKNLSQKIADLQTQAKRHEFSPASLEQVEDSPIVYWWDKDFVEQYLEAQKLDEIAEVRGGMKTADNTRFLRRPWEVNPAELLLVGFAQPKPAWKRGDYLPYIKGGAGSEWMEPVEYIVRWRRSGLALGTYSKASFNAEEHYFTPGVALTAIGKSFGARIHRFRSIFDMMGQSAFGENPSSLLCALNRQKARDILQALNPTLHFQVRDILRTPLYEVDSADSIVSRLDEVFTNHEAAREASVEFKKPGPSVWAYAQKWVQQAVDRPEGEPLPDWQPEYDEAPPENWLSWAVGVALGRFDEAGEVGWLNVDPLRLANNARHLPDSGRSTKGFGESLLADEEGLGREAGSIERSDSAADGEGGRPRNPSTPQPLNLPDGILFVTATDGDDSLAHRATELLHEMWDKYGDDVGRNKDDLNSWLREKFFKSVHRQMYDNAPIYFPLSSEQKTFVAHVNIHRWDEHTLTKLLANHLVPERNRLEGLLSDLNRGRASDDDDTRRRAEDQYADVKAWLEELEQFIADVEQCAEKGAPSTGKGCPEREVDARFIPDLDDGTMINSAALWPLFYPQWKKPKKQWKKLANEKGFRGKHFDWSTLAARYWPTRVDQKCQEDPSLAVAHKCFWRYHPERAYEWELRLQDEIHPNFTIDEEGSDAARKAFFADQADKVEGIRADEYNRRERNADGEADILPVAAPEEHPTSGDVVPEAESSKGEGATQEQQADGVPAE